MALANIKYSALQTALRTTTETLAHELARPTANEPDWSDFEWRIARAVAAMHGVSALLSGTLRWVGPPGWREFLREQKAQTAARHPRIENLLKIIDQRMRADDIPLVALKGAELHARGLYCPGERPMADVDLLVRSADVPRTSRALESLGFYETLSNWKHKAFIPNNPVPPSGLGERADNYLKIELHERICEILPLDTAEVTEQMFPRQPHPGLNGYPSIAALMSHLLLHAAGAMAYRALRLVHLNDIARLSAQMSCEDWNEVLREPARVGGPWWALPPLQLAARYYSSSIPAGVLAHLADDCPRLLRVFTQRRTLSDVSLSRLRIDAFPGIEWSQSISELARYIMSRLHPGRETLELRAHASRSQPAEQQSEWQRLSQTRRILRWIVSRQARSETLYNVRTALAQTQ